MNISLYLQRHITVYDNKYIGKLSIYKSISQLIFEKSTNCIEKSISYKPDKWQAESMKSAMDSLPATNFS